MTNRPAALFGELDLHLFNEGNHTTLWRNLGGRLSTTSPGAHFSVWAPNAQHVEVRGDFTGWANAPLPLERLGTSGVWTGWSADAQRGHHYKFHLTGARGSALEKADPMAFKSEQHGTNASILDDLTYTWNDDAWMDGRHKANRWDGPISIYEVHLGSWKHANDEDRPLSYLELINELVPHVRAMGFTHVELLPVTEHPLYASWGYQATGYFAATSRYGSPVELMQLIDAFHAAGIGVILDWVPSHFPTDAFALSLFDETHLYEHADPREGFHPDWKSAIFNYGRHEVRSFLLSSARFWLEQFHFDGLRVDAVASMLYRDYSRGNDWVPNRYGGRENLEAVTFLQQLNHEMYAAFPDALMIAEESTAWPGVTRRTDQEGLGFGYKWDMGWMNDTLAYFAEDPINRRYHHNKLTFRSMYGATENFVLPLSHDEVVHGKGSLLNKMPGDVDQQFADLRLLLGWQFATPGKKLLFMGSELGGFTEWNHDDALPWWLTNDERHEGVLQWVRELNALYRTHSALHAGDTQADGFRWVDANNADESMFSAIRSDGSSEVAIIMNATPVPRSFALDRLGDRSWSVALSSVATAASIENGWLACPGLSITFLTHG